NKKNASGTGGVPPQSQVDGAKKADVGAIAMDGNDEGDRKGKKAKKNAKKGKKVASAKSVPEVEKTFSDSDEELMGNRKQRAKKKQEAHAQQGGNDWEEEGFDYGEEEEVGEQVN
ncbi:hypothetical protein IOCL2690_000017300, partial [Leishmania lindenbergi]